jgi:deferrochelatase/peroxidase EfeB
VTWPLPSEEPLDLDEIQGHLLIGFGGAPQALGAFTARDLAASARTVSRWAGRVTSARALLPRKGRRARDFVGRVGSGPWIAMAVSHRLVQAAGHAAGLDDDWVANASMAAVSGLNDPRPADGGPRGGDWVVGAPDRPVDVLIVVAAGTAAAAQEVIDWFTADAQPWLDGDPFVEQLQPLPGGKEHFGFRDGISQPALFGTVDGGTLLEADRVPDDLGLPRTKAAQDLVWPGEFVFGYRGTTAEPRVPAKPVNPAGGEGPAALLRNGSLLVYRRLEQDVPAFRKFCVDAVAQVEAEQPGLDAESVAQLIVGRRLDGLPLAAAPGSSTDDAQAMNGFTFLHDAMDQACPFSAHIRKVNPRLGPQDQRVRRILRRGAPFGPPLDEADATTLEVSRGLAFMAYMTSTNAQFGMLSRDWMADPGSPAGRGGHDVLVGQVAQGTTRSFDIHRDPPELRIEAGAETWVRMTGGAFLLLLSLSALRGLAGRPAAARGVATDDPESAGEAIAAPSGPEPEDLARAIRQFAIYERPSDFPEGYVVREWLVTGDEVLPGNSMRAATLDQALKLLPAGIEQVAGRDPHEPTIVGVWM